MHATKWATVDDVSSVRRQRWLQTRLPSPGPVRRTLEPHWWALHCSTEATHRWWRAGPEATVQDLTKKISVTILGTDRSASENFTANPGNNGVGNLLESGGLVAIGMGASPVVGFEFDGEESRSKLPPSIEGSRARFTEPTGKPKRPRGRRVARVEKRERERDGEESEDNDHQGYRREGEGGGLRRQGR